jgi:hypothetical protein
MNLKKKTIVGLTEKVVIFDVNGKKKTIHARIDTGAVTSSIDKHIVEDMDLGPIAGYKIVRQANGKTKRPIYKIKIIINGREFLSSFTIADRKEMTYRMLVGQNILKQDFLIDPSIKE